MALPKVSQHDDVKELERLAAAVKLLREQVAQRIVGQEEAVDGILTAILAGGHALLIGVPGLAKTLMVQTVAEALELSLQPGPVHPRPDAERHHRHRDPRGGPGHRRAGLPVRAGADLRQRGAGRRDQPDPAQDPGRPAPGHAGAPGHRRRARPTTLPDPFFVLATQNPIEQEGTYPLPEAQLDRFMLELRVGYPVAGRGRDDRRADHRQPRGRAEPVLDAEALHGDAGAGAADPGVARPDPLGRGAGPDDPAGRRRGAGADQGISSSGAPGPGPRSTWCSAPRPGPRWTAGRWPTSTTCKAVAPSVLRHRVVTNFAAEAADRTSEDLIRELVAGESWRAKS